VSLFAYSCAASALVAGDVGEKVEYRRTRTALPRRIHASGMADELRPRERALRELPLTYSLALRLRDAGVASEVVCEYVGVEEASLDGVYRIAEAKLASALNVDPTHDGPHADTK
jgi:hypothetical protein